MSTPSSSPESSAPESSAPALEAEPPATGPFAAAPKARDTSADPVETGPKAPNSLLTRPTDHAAKPGFRSAPNKNSKAQKPSNKKK